jgi:hypothetical protein
MWRRVALVRTDVSEERITPTIRVTAIGDVRTALTVTITANVVSNSLFFSPCWWRRHVLRTSVLTGDTWHHIPEEDILQIEIFIFWKAGWNTLTFTCTGDTRSGLSPTICLFSKLRNHKPPVNRTQTSDNLSIYYSGEAVSPSVL